MQDLDVAPGSLDPVAAALCAVCDGGTTRLAAGVVDDIVDGFGAEAAEPVLDSTLPEVVDLLAQQTGVIGDRLTTAAGAYRRADWIARVAMDDRR